MTKQIKLLRFIWLSIITSKHVLSFINAPLPRSLISNKNKDGNTILLFSVRQRQQPWHRNLNSQKATDARTRKDFNYDSNRIRDRKYDFMPRPPPGYYRPPTPNAFYPRPNYFTSRANPPLGMHSLEKQYRFEDRFLLDSPSEHYRQGHRDGYKGPYINNPNVTPNYGPNKNYQPSNNLYGPFDGPPPTYPYNTNDQLTSNNNSQQQQLQPSNYVQPPQSMFQGYHAPKQESPMYQTPQNQAYLNYPQDQKVQHQQQQNSIFFSWPYPQDMQQDDQPAIDVSSSSTSSNSSPDTVEETQTRTPLPNPHNNNQVKQQENSSSEIPYQPPNTSIQQQQQQQAMPIDPNMSINANQNMPQQPQPQQQEIHENMRLQEDYQQLPPYYNPQYNYFDFDLPPPPPQFHYYDYYSPSPQIFYDDLPFPPLQRQWQGPRAMSSDERYLRNMGSRRGGMRSQRRQRRPTYNRRYRNY